METLETLKYDFWGFFKEISSIPRKSGEEDKIAKYLINFAKNRNLEYYRDSLNNVIIWKEASIGYEYKEILGLQCHTDMICEKKINSEHDFSTEPLELFVQEDYIKAKNTTLGADNGIGIAYILAILNSKKIKTPKLECIFTVQEETTMNGAKYLDPSILKAKKIISFDNFNEDEMWISSASAEEWSSVLDTKKITLNPNNYTTFCLTLKHFKGGHSGLNISDSSRGNPIKIISNILSCFSSINIYDFEGGSKVNIIPRNCKIIFAINNYELSKINILKNSLTKILKKYPDVYVDLEKVETKEQYIDKQSSANILNFIQDFKNGAIERDIYNNTILSGNFASIKIQDSNVIFLYSIRYNSKELGISLMKEIEDSMKQNNILVKEYTHILGYEQNDNSKLVKFCENQYYKYFNKEIKKIRVQACLECGYFSEKIHDLQFIAIAPNIYDAHSPSERMSIKSANRMWHFIIKLLENFN